jgi:hypothetical protein
MFATMVETTPSQTFFSHVMSYVCHREKYAAELQIHSLFFILDG